MIPEPTSYDEFLTGAVEDREEEREQALADAESEARAARRAVRAKKGERPHLP